MQESFVHSEGPSGFKCWKGPNELFKLDMYLTKYNINHSHCFVSKKNKQTSLLKNSFLSLSQHSVLVNSLGTKGPLVGANALYITQRGAPFGALLCLKAKGPSLSLGAKGVAGRNILTKGNNTPLGPFGTLYSLPNICPKGLRPLCGIYSKAAPRRGERHLCLIGYANETEKCIRTNQGAESRKSRLPAQSVTSAIYYRGAAQGDGKKPEGLCLKAPLRGFQTYKAIAHNSALQIKTNVSKRPFQPPFGAAASYTDKDKVVSITYEEIGLFPRSFSRVLDRFLKQLFSDVDNLVIQEYRFYRYLFLTTIKTIFVLFFVPFVVNFIAKNYVVKPITEYFWNTSHPEIFLSSYEQKHAFAELEKFEEKMYFEALVEAYPGHGKVAMLSLASQGSAPPILDNSEGHKSQLTFLQYLNPKGPKGASLKSAAPSEDLPILASSSVGTDNWRSLPFVVAPSGPRRAEAFSPLGIYCEARQEEASIRDTENPEKREDPQRSERLTRDAQSYSIQPRPFGERRCPVGAKASHTVGVREGNFIGLEAVRAKLYQEKTIELALYYNNHSIEAWTNFFADLLSLCTLLYLLITLEIQINITKSFLLEVFFGLDDSKKSLLILLVTDLLVGYHSSNLWELFFEFIFNHYGIPESQTGIFLLVATLPVLLDVLFKYLIFRHLNRSSPATVATYQAIIE